MIGSSLVSEINTSWNGVAKSFERSSILAEATKVVELKTAKDSASLTSNSILKRDEEFNVLTKASFKVAVCVVAFQFVIVLAGSPEPLPVVILSFAPRYAWSTFERITEPADANTTFEFDVDVLTLPTIDWFTLISNKNVLYS